MPTIVSTGQVTIVDQNDAKPITSLISASGLTTQVVSKKNNVNTWKPNYTANNLTLTANVYVGGVNVAGDSSVISGIVWSADYNGATALSTARTLVRNTNIPVADGAVTYYFRCTYTDPVTGIATRVDNSIVLTVVEAGAEAVFVQTMGQDTIVQADSATKNAVAIKAVLVRPAGIDGDNLQYRWSTVAPDGTVAKIYTGHASVGGLAVKTTASNAAPAVGATVLGSSTLTTAGITTATTSDTDADWCTGGSPGYNTLVIGEAAVIGTQTFKVEVRDTVDKTAVYETTFTIKDKTDPYTVEVLPDSDRLLNGTGSTNVYAKAYCGAAEISSYNSWSFKWTCKNKDGARAGLTVFSANDTPAAMAGIQSNDGTTITTKTSVTLVAGDILKLVSAGGGTVKYVQVNVNVTSGVGTTPTIALKTSALSADANTLSAVTALGTANGGEFKDGYLVKVVASKQVDIPATGVRSYLDTKLVVSQYDVDAKNSFQVEVTRP